MECFDVIIVGAGIAGIGAARRLQDECPGKSFALLEQRAALGGTWDLFRYPGIRSDSDMYTMGYDSKPWRDPQAISSGESIRAYLEEAAAERGLGRHIRFGHKLVAARWSSDEARWTLDVALGDGGTASFACRFLFMCSGYYSYDAGYTPPLPGLEEFSGKVVHPQAWPPDLDYAGKRVVIVGSGATAMTLVPAMADRAAHVTMLQRSPTYVVSAPDQDPIANTLRKVLPDRVAYGITRKKNVALQQFMYGRTRTQPEKVKQTLLKRVREELGESYDVDTHFTPRYNPWDQRMCLVPNSDLFKAIRDGKASVVTDHIETFDETGITLQSGEHLDADVIVTATGLNLVTLGEMAFFVDGEQVDFSRTWTYKGMAYSDVPNLVSTFGYINASWTLRADLTSEYVCRLLNHLRSTGTVQCTPRLRPSDANMPERPWIDDFSAGYMQRVMDRFPKQGDREPWINPQNYSRDKKLFRKAPLDDGCMQFTRLPVREPART